MHTLPTQTPGCYDALAPFYECHWGGRFMSSATHLFSDLIGRRLKPGAQALDLCCGTGDFAEWLVASGLNVTGVDNSNPMLDCARARVAGAQFYHADMFGFRLPLQFDVATCFYNSMNQALTPASLGAVLRSVRLHLRLGAWFLFDMVEEHAYLDSWEADEVVSVESSTCEVRYRYDHVRGLALCHVRIDGSASPLREFTFLQRPLSIEAVRRELEESGFALESVSAVPGSLPAGGRLAVLARATGLC